MGVPPMGSEASRRGRLLVNGQDARATLETLRLTRFRLHPGAGRERGAVPAFRGVGFGQRWRDERFVLCPASFR